MSKQLRELQARKATLVKDARALTDIAAAEQRDMNDEEVAAFEALKAKIEATSNAIDRESALIFEEAQMNHPSQLTTASVITGRCSRQRLTRPPVDPVVEMAGFASSTGADPAVEMAGFGVPSVTDPVVGMAGFDARRCTATVTRLICSSRAILRWDQPRSCRAIIAFKRFTSRRFIPPVQPEGARDVNHPLKVAGFESTLRGWF